MPEQCVLIVSARWQIRALLAAQLGKMQERDILSAPGVDEALGLIKLAGADPALLIVDAGQEFDRADVERLIEARPKTPVVLIISTFRRAAFDPLRAQCAAYLIRPVSIGQIARHAAQILQRPGRSQD